MALTKLFVPATCAGLIFLVGCASPKPTPAEVAAQIKGVPEFKAAKMGQLSVGFSLPAGTGGKTPALTQSCTACSVFESLGMARYDRDPADPGGFVFVLTPKGQQASLDWVNAGRPPSFTSGTLYQLPMATKELVGIGPMTRIGDAVEVAFSWRWVPNEIGKALGVDTKVQNSQAFLTKYAVGWRVEGRIEGME